MVDTEEHKMSAKSRMRSKRKKIEIKKKEFRYHGMTLEEIKKLSIDELIPILPSRARRTLKRGLTKTQDKLLNDIEKAKQGDIIKTHCRNMIILPSFVGHRIDVHNGISFQRVDIQPHMIGHYLGEFAMTRKKVKHTGPGVGATRSSKYMPLK
jgi:small subunit ribosomal protein S19